MEATLASSTNACVLRESVFFFPSVHNTLPATEVASLKEEGDGNKVGDTQGELKPEEGRRQAREIESSSLRLVSHAKREQVKNQRACS